MSERLQALSLSVQAAVTNYHRLIGLNSKLLFSHISGGWRSKMKVLAGLVSGEGSLPALESVDFLLYPHRMERKKEAASSLIIILLKVLIIS